jgi:diguanylate cyclase (GGDEF)-like protein/PAS domain S-box-containing protein
MPQRPLGCRGQGTRFEPVSADGAPRNPSTRTRAPRAPARRADGGIPGTPQSRMLLQNVLESLPDAVTLSTAVRNRKGVATDMRLGYMNAVARAGHENAKAVIGGLCSELWPGMVQNGTFQKCMDVLNTGESESGTLEWIDAQTGRPAGCDYRAIRVGDNILLWVLHDTTETIQAARSLEESEERYRSVLAALDEGIVVQARDGTVLAANAAAERMLAFEASTALPPNVNDWSLIDEDGLAIATDEVPTAVVFRSAQAQTARVIGISIDEELRWFSVNVYPLLHPGETEPFAVVSSLNDVTERRALEAELKYLALHDSLTELPNRTLILDRMNQAMRRARQQRDDAVGRLGVIVTDLEGFKTVNERFGHEAGDHVLKEVAMRLLTTVREQDAVGRLGDDEFVVLLEDVDPEDLADHSKKVAEVLQRPVVYEGPGSRLIDINITARVGDALAKSRDSAKDLLHRADRALRNSTGSLEG